MSKKQSKPVALLTLESLIENRIELFFFNLFKISIGTFIHIEKKY